jgi:hypothetical protein
VNAEFARARMLSAVFAISAVFSDRECLLLAE